MTEMPGVCGRRIGVRALLCILWFALLWYANRVQAHENLPATLIVQELRAGEFEVRWRVPQTQGAAPAIQPEFPADCVQMGSWAEVSAPGARLRHSQWRCAQGLRGGATVTIDGLGATSVDTLVQVQYADGGRVSAIARPRAPTVMLAQEKAQGIALQGYSLLGVEHILSGIDHLLFVLCLTMLVPHVRGLVKTITAFTVAHSVTLALAALEWVHVPQPPVEATIALSILFLTRELARRGQGAGMAAKRPWAVAFVFGLLHGFGFAGALAEVGLPQGDIPAALFLFNVGVEAGQLGFVALAYPALLLLRRMEQGWPAWAPMVPVYAVGSVAAFWWLQRMLVVVG